MAKDYDAGELEEANELVSLRRTRVEVRGDALEYLETVVNQATKMEAKGRTLRSGVLLCYDTIACPVGSSNDFSLLCFIASHPYRSFLGGP